MKTTAKLYESPQKEQNEQKFGSLTNQCICCGRPMKPGETKLVHMNTDWMAVESSINEKDCLTMTGAESQGYFSIGNSCARKMPRGFIIENL